MKYRIVWNRYLGVLGKDGCHSLSGTYAAKLVVPIVAYWVVCLLLPCGCNESEHSVERASSFTLHLPARASAGVPIAIGVTGSSTSQVQELLFDFGDNQRIKTSSCSFVAHAYQAPGRYTVVVRYRTEYVSGSLSRSIDVVKTHGPEATFTVPSDHASPAFGDLPFPNELYRGPDGRILVDKLPVKRPVLKEALEQGLATVDGFGTTAAAFVWFSDTVDVTTLPQDPYAFTEPGSPVFMINIDPSSPSYKKRIPLMASWDDEDKRLSVLPYPGSPLEEHTLYGLVVTSFLTGTTGSVTPSADFVALRDHKGFRLQAPENVLQAYTQLWATLEDEIDIPRVTTLPCATVFVTQRISRWLVPICQAINADSSGIPDPAPTFDARYIYREDYPATVDTLIGVQPLSGPGYDPPAHDQVRAIVTKAFYTSPVFLSEDRDLFDSQGGQFVFKNGIPEMQGTRRVPFTLTIPRTPPPPEGYPVVIIGHGLGLARWYEPVLQANELARKGFAVAAIDAVMHGDRYDVHNINPVLALVLHTVPPKLGMEFPLGVQDSMYNYTGASGEDGWADPNYDGAQLAFIKGFANFAGVRDNVLQTTVDLMQLARVFRKGLLNIQGLGQLQFQKDGVFYLGNSLGAWIGSLLVSVDPCVRADVLNCGGGGIVINLLVNSPAFGGEFGPVLSLLLGLDEKDLSSMFSPVLNLVQIIVEPMDPLNWAAYAAGRSLCSEGNCSSIGKQVLLNEVMWDNSMPNEATEALARAFGAVLLEPFYREVPFVPPGGFFVSGNRDSGRSTVVLAQYAPAEHGFNIGWRRGHIYYQIGFPFEEPPRFRPVVDAQGRPTMYPIRNPVEAGVAQYIDFFVSVLTEGIGRVEMKYGYVPVHDYDDDGCTDDLERAAGTDPSNPLRRPAQCP